MRHRVRRLPSDRPVKLTTAHGDQRASIENVSPQGASLRGVDAALSPGDRAELGMLFLRLGARIVWVRGGMAGLRFDRPLTAQEMTCLRGATGPAPSQPAARFDATALREL